MIKAGTLLALALTLVAGCNGGSTGDTTGTAGTGAAGTGAAGSGAAGTTGAAGATGAAGTTGAAGVTGAAGTLGGAGTEGGAGTAAQTAGSSGADASAGTTGAAGSTVPDGTAGASGGAGMTGAAGVGPNMLPTGYKGTPFAALTIPGRINAADYDRGGAGVAWCHDTGACGSGTTTGDYPSGSPVYRPPIPSTAKLCSGAACDDNVGVCRMNPQKPDKTSPTNPAPPADTYLCYSTGGEWTKYTVVVTQAGTYAVGGFMAVPQGGAVNLSFGGTITTGNLTLAVTNPSVCGGGEYYHCWAQRENLSTVTFPTAGTYLMTLTQVGRFNADNFTFTKM